MSNSGRDFLFEERKLEQKPQKFYEQPNIDDQTQEQKFYKGGGGGGNSNGFFSIKTNVYSKQCYSDPENPGKMICKEIKNSSGYDPFNKDNNFKKTKENVYSKEAANQAWPGNNKSGEINISFNPSEGLSIFDKISNNIKGLFSKREDQDSSYRTQNFSNDPYFEQEKNKQFPHDDPYEYNSHDPFIEQFDRMFKNMQYEFFKNAFFDSDELEDNQDPFKGFFPEKDIFEGSREFPSNHRYPQGHSRLDEEFDDIRNFFGGGRGIQNENHKENYHLRQDKFVPNKDYNQFKNNQNEENFHTEQQSKKEIKYRDSKIYDV